jgi:hypothetical protein
MKSWSETVNCNLNKYAYGNSQTDTIFDYLFGSDWDKQLAEDGKTLVQLTGADMIKRQKELAKFMQNNSENFGSAWS